MASLTPSGGLLLNTTQYTYVTETVTAVGFSSVSWSWTLTEVDAPTGAEGRNINITPSGLILSVEYFSEETLFPIQWIDYVSYTTGKKQRTRVLEFSELPNPKDSSEIVSFRNDPQNLLIWQLDVTATGTDTQGMPANASGSYTIYVYANYDINAQGMIEAINDRSGY